MSGTVLVLAHAHDVGASMLAQRLRRLTESDSVIVVRPEALGLAHWSQTISAGGDACVRLRLPRLPCIESDDVDWVFNRLQYLPIPRFHRAPPKDRDYAGAELQALVASWLLSSGERVINPSGPRGQSRGPISERGWLMLAAQVGLPVARSARATAGRMLPAPDVTERIEATEWPGGTRGPAPATLSGHAPPGGRVLVVGDNALGPLADRFGPQCVDLARLAECTLLEIRFAETPQGPVVREIDPMPPLIDDWEVDAVAALLVRDRRYPIGPAPEGRLASSTTNANADIARRPSGAGPIEYRRSRTRGGAAVLLYGRDDDAPMRQAAEAARELDHSVIWLDQTALERTDLMLTVDRSGVAASLRTDGCQVDLDTVSGIYARPLNLPRIWPDALAQARAVSFHELFLEWLELSPNLVVSRPSDMESNGSKPYQTQLIAASRFDVPETLVTSDPDEARAFWAQHGRVVFKSISGVRSIVTELDDAHAARLERLRDLPVQLQAFVPGEDVRVHVVGNKTFACLIESPATDYRYAQRVGVDAQLTTLDLPKSISNRCVELAERLRLPFCGVDLRRTPDGRWVCFEVNPMPAYTYFENETGLPISRALIDLLANG